MYLFLVVQSSLLAHPGPVFQVGLSFQVHHFSQVVRSFHVFHWIQEVPLGQGGRVSHSYQVLLVGLSVHQYRLHQASLSYQHHPMINKYNYLLISNDCKAHVFSRRSSPSWDSRFAGFTRRSSHSRRTIFTRRTSASGDTIRTHLTRRSWERGE